MAAAKSNDLPLTPAPADSVQCMEWSPVQNILAAGSWDNCVRCWEVAPNGSFQVSGEQKGEGPILDLSWREDGAGLFFASCDKTVKLWDVASNSVMQVAGHDAPVKTCHWVPALQCVMTGSWDKTVRFWDTRSPQPAAAFTMPDRVYAADVVGTLAVVVSAQRNISVLNLSGGPREHSKPDSLLKHQIRTVKCFPTQDGFAIGSIEGRVGIHYVDPSKAKVNNFSFKCHREGLAIHAVHSIAFHPKFGTFATTGSDGKYMFWDKENRSRLKQFSSPSTPSGPLPVTSSAFSADGTLFAYSCSYDWSKGHEHYNPAGPNAVMVHPVAEEEVRPQASGK